ncbi:hypothetical protein AOQ84DRAFT_407549 [Glonium stellatum]|uniref:Tyrosinase copper-binding domain-containing protein n=1 Tax=Glonium stellatum TaxID=574774 RepID=A0A8E2FC38_9PEZI|nr:hypothetical protein AOQ84DRAFT_407549 [Glonium stellatum]
MVLGKFIEWHRYSAWAYEQALRNECGYIGYQPYWNWVKSAMGPLNSPMFDGSDTSMSDNGEYLFGNQSWVSIPTNDAPGIKIPKGTGGSCVKTGPFEELSARSGRKVNFGPMFSALTYVKQNPDPSGFDTYYNLCCPRCGISQWTSSRWAKDSDISWMINTNTEIYSFWSLLRGDFSGSYWMWQNQDPARGMYAIAGTITILKAPTSTNVSLDDLIDLSVNNEPIKLRDAMSTLGGPFCSVYAQCLHFHKALTGDQHWC